jgi:hypothetical protein
MSVNFVTEYIIRNDVYIKRVYRGGIVSRCHLNVGEH